MKENETKTQNKPQSKWKRIGLKILNTVINIMIILVLIVSVLIAAMALTSKSNGISTVFGYTIQPIQSNSMLGGSPDGYPGGDFGQGDLMIAKATDFDSTAVYQLGDIVTFRAGSSISGDAMLIAHRIVDVVVDENGNYSYQTQGDNRETSPDPDQFETKDYLTASSIGSVFYSDSYQGTILKGWGSVLDFLQTQLGFFLVVLLPMIIFFMYELIRVVLNFNNYKKAKVDEEKEAAVKEAVAVALAGQQVDEDEAAFEKMSPEEREQFKAFLELQKAQHETVQNETDESDPSAETAE